MAKLPRAPDLARLSQLDPALIALAPGQLLYRVYSRGGSYPTHWNAFRHFGPLSRVDHHLPDRHGDPVLQTCGILYAATDVATTVAEFFERNRRRVNRYRRQSWLVSFALHGEVRLLDITDTFPVRAGASSKLAAGPYSHAQNWSRGFYDAYPAIQGVYYRSSLTGRPSIALYERARSAGIFPRAPRFHRALADPALLDAMRNVVEEIGYTLL